MAEHRSAHVGQRDAAVHDAQTLHAGHTGRERSARGRLHNVGTEVASHRVHGHRAEVTLPARRNFEDVLRTNGVGVRRRSDLRRVATSRSVAAAVGVQSSVRRSEARAKLQAAPRRRDPGDLVRHVFGADVKERPSKASRAGVGAGVTVPRAGREGFTRGDAAAGEQRERAVTLADADDTPAVPTNIAIRTTGRPGRRERAARGRGRTDVALEVRAHFRLGTVDHAIGQLAIEAEIQTEVAVHADGRVLRAVDGRTVGTRARIGSVNRDEAAHVNDDLAGFRLGLGSAESRSIAARVRRSERSGLSRRRGNEAQQGRRSEKIVAHIILLVCRPRPVPTALCPGFPRQSPKTGGAAKPENTIGRTMPGPQSLKGGQDGISETLWHWSDTFITLAC